MEEELHGIKEFVKHEMSKGPKASPGSTNYRYQELCNIYNYFMIRHITGGDFTKLCIPGFKLVWKGYVTKATVAVDVSKRDLYVSPGLKDAIESCRNKHRFAYLTLSIFGKSRKNIHVNILLIDTKNKVLERFEPYGKCNHGDLINNGMKELLRLMGMSDYEYLGPNLTSPSIGIQEVADSYAGMCVTISMLYVHLRVMNPNTKPKKIISKLLRMNHGDLKDLILKFAGYSESTIKQYFRKLIAAYDTMLVRPSCIHSIN